MARRLALIIGNSLYQDQTLARLKSPDADVGALYEILKDAEVGGFDDVKLLANVNSTTVRRAISEFFSHRIREDLLLLYFSGHGVLDDRGRLYLAVKDTDRNYLRASAIPAAFIADEMDNSRSQRQVLMLDCCHSGAFARGTKGVAGARVGTAAAFEGTGYGRVVLTATDATQYAWEGDRILGEAQTSLFTTNLIEGLQTGSADQNADGKITVDELFDFVYERTVKQTPQQTPGKWSYKEQGEIVIALSKLLGGQPEVPLSILEPEVDVDLQQRLEKLYIDGLSAYWLEDWDRSIGNFQNILEVQPDYKDAQARLEGAVQNRRFETLYRRARTAQENENWAEAQASFEALILEAGDYRDSKILLEQVKQQKQLAGLYAQARQLHQAGKWQAVMRVFDQLKAAAPDYPDPEDLLDSARQHQAEQERQAQIEDLYTRALLELDSRRWDSARQLLTQLLEKEPGYRDAGGLLARAEAEVSRQEAERQRQEQVEAFYQQAIVLAGAGRWRQAKEKMQAIHALQPGFPDPEGIAARAEAELAQQEEPPAPESEDGLAKTRPQPRWALGVMALAGIVLLLAAGVRMLLPAGSIQEQGSSPTGPASILTNMGNGETAATPGAPAAALQRTSTPTETPAAAAPTRTAASPARLPAPTATPEGLAKIRLVITSSSDWANIRLSAVGKIQELTMIEREGFPGGGFAPSILSEENSIYLGQPLQVAEAGNRIGATVDVLIEFFPSGSQNGSSGLEIAIEKGALGETVVEVYNTAGSEPGFLKRFKRTSEEQTVRSWIEAAEALEPARRGDACLVSSNLGSTNAEYGLEQVEGGDGKTASLTSITESGGNRSARRTLDTPFPARYIFFRLSPLYERVKNGSRLIVTVEYLDQGTAKFSVQYNSSDANHPDSAHKATEKIVDTRGSGYWKSARFWIYDAAFQGRQDQEADFRIHTGGDFELIVNRVMVETQDCPD